MGRGHTAMRTKPTRRERKESKKITLRLRRFRTGEVERLREDAMRFNLSDAVTMASIRREVAALIGDNSGTTTMHLHEGRLIWVRSGDWVYKISGMEIKATHHKGNFE